MTGPTPPATKLDEAAALLTDALRDVLRDLDGVDWSARVEAIPPWQPVTPMGWVDVPTVAPAGSGIVSATFPVVVAVDGSEKVQVRQLRTILARGWDAFPKVSVGGMAARVLTAGPQFIETGAGETRGVVFSVQVDLQARTLCHGSITASNP